MSGRSVKHEYAQPPALRAAPAGQWQKHRPHFATQLINTNILCCQMLERRGFVTTNKDHRAWRLRAALFRDQAQYPHVWNQPLLSFLMKVIQRHR
jgi:hypothetical protein